MLFWIMLDIIKYIKSKNPDVIFLMENVKMRNSFEEYITYHTEQSLGKVNKHLINSTLVSAQNRTRYYWTNIENIKPPSDKGIFISDILNPGAVAEDPSLWLRPDYFKGVAASNYLDENTESLVWRIPEATIKGYVEIREGQSVELSYRTSTSRRGRAMFLKTNCLTAVRPIFCVLQKGWFRHYSLEELEKLQTVPPGYTQGVSESQRANMLGNGWTVDVIVHIYKFIDLAEFW